MRVVVDERDLVQDVSKCDRSFPSADDHHSDGIDGESVGDLCAAAAEAHPAAPSAR